MLALFYFYFYSKEASKPHLFKLLLKVTFFHSVIIFDNQYHHSCGGKTRMFYCTVKDIVEIKIVLHKVNVRKSNKNEIYDKCFIK